MPRGAARLLAVCLAGAMALPLAVTGAAGRSRAPWPVASAPAHTF
jgi:hypothetical protein